MRIQTEGGKIAIIIKAVDGPGYWINPVLGFNDMNPFGGMTYRTVQAAKTAILEA